MDLVPLGDRVIVKQTVVENVRPSGLVLPSDAVEKPSEGVVVAVGDEIEKLQQGDAVIFSKYGGMQVKDGEDELLVLRESDVLCRRPSSR